MKRILSIIAVIFSLCIAASSVAAQTNEQDQSVYIYSIVKFKNTLQNSTWKVSLTVDLARQTTRRQTKLWMLMVIISCSIPTLLHSTG